MYEGGTLKGNCTLYVWWMILGYLVVDAPLDAENIWGRGLGAVLECVWWVKTVKKKLYQGYVVVSSNRVSLRVNITHFNSILQELSFLTSQTH